LGQGNTCGSSGNSCGSSGFEIADHFAELNKMVDIGRGTKRCLKDYELTSYAGCRYKKVEIF
jgi:DNA-damage-inducible protein D